MSLIMLRAQIKNEKTTEVEEAARSMFAAINEARPEGVRYASCRIPDDSTFVILLQLEDGIDNPLTALPEFATFQANVKDWVTEQPTPERLSVVGSYNLF